MKGSSVVTEKAHMGKILTTDLVLSQMFSTLPHLKC